MNCGSRQIVVCMTGFTQNPKLQQYRKAISELGCKLIEQLAQGTDILLVDNTCTEKYKIAKLKKNMTECLTIKWLEDSVEAGKALPISEKYQLPSIFYGIKIGIFGFKEKESKSIKQTIQQNGGKVYIIQSSLQDDLKVILTKRQDIKKSTIIQEIQCPIVGIEWVEQSLNAGICKYPNDYALNLQSLAKYQPVNSISRLKRKLSSILQTSYLDKWNQFLFGKQQCLIHIHRDSVDNSLNQILKKLVCVTGGMYLNHTSPCLTHILVGNVTDAEYKSLLSFGDYTQILRIQWLIDCMLFSERLPEVDYKVRSFRRKTDENYYPNSISMKKVQENSFMKMKMDRKSVSNITLTQTKPQMKKTKTRIEPVKSTIFKHKHFFIDSSQKREKQLFGIMTKIRQNCGTIYDKPAKGLNYVVMIDSTQNISILEGLQSTGKQLQPVSHRWINICITKGQFIDPNTPQFFIFKPFKFKTPCSEMMFMKIQIIGIKDQIQRIRFIEVLNALGSHRISPNKVDITHCICGAQFRKDPKLKEIRRQNQNVRFLRLQWLKKSMSEGIKPWQGYEIIEEELQTE